MSTGVTAILVLAGVGVGVYVGVKLTKSAVQSGAVGAVDSVIRMVNGDPEKGYGHVAHSLADMFLGGVLN